MIQVTTCDQIIFFVAIRWKRNSPGLSIKQQTVSVGNFIKIGIDIFLTIIYNADSEIVN